MDLETFNQTIETARNRLSRNCMLCKTYKSFRPRKSEEYKKDVLVDLKKIAIIFLDQYNEFRTNNDYADRILKAKELRTLSLDLIDLCRNCTKETELIKSNIRKIENLQ